MSMRDRVQAMFTAPVAEAHCDGPCGVYDPASARVTAEAVLSMTKKMLDLHVPEGSDDAAWAGYLNSMSRFAAIKEETISGRLVPIATMVMPVNHSLMPKLRAMPTPPSTNNLAPPTKRTSPNVISNV